MKNPIVMTACWPRVLFALCLVAWGLCAEAQEPNYPNKPIRVVVPFVAGGPNDIGARLIAPRLSQLLRVPVVVDNKPGASSAIGALDVARATPDGYTLLYTSDITLAQIPHLFKKLAFDPLRDFTPIAQTAVMAQVLVAHRSLPAKDLSELIAYAKSNPGKLNFGSPGLGTSPYLTAELLRLQSGISITQVPYKGGGEALKDLVAGHIEVMFSVPTTVMSNVRGGRIKILGVAGPRRLALIPDVPTLAEQGVVGLDIPLIYGFLGPANLPPSVVRVLNREVINALRSPEIRERFMQDAVEVVGSTPEQYAVAIRDLYDRWGQAIRRSGVKLD
jgi:tripartite-type tricarboxylate transporter receptor subunit TctC